MPTVVVAERQEPGRVPAAEAIAEFGKLAQEGKLQADYILGDGSPLKFDTLLDLLPNTDTPAVLHVSAERPPCTHRRLRRFIADEFGAALQASGLGPNDRVAILFPNGPELAVAFVAVLSYCTCAPLNPANTPAEIKGELVNTNSKGLMVMEGEDNEGILEVASELGICVLSCARDDECCGVFDVEQLQAGKTTPKPTLVASSRQDVAMVLHTSGSTGNKKVVPHTVEDLLAGAICIASACQLTPDDRCCNQMPLFHVGGIARNVLSPIISGGSVVAMPYFEPGLFWKVAAEHKCSWYYAGPTMHMLILDTYKAMTPRPSITLRFIANAAGPLLPSVASDMRDTYTEGASRFVSIMPSYGMTEVMPISSPPVGYNLDKPGTSGRIVGPRCSIRTPDGVLQKSGDVGEIMCQGHPVMRGYENNPEETKKNLVEGTDGSGEWFKTGDLGYMDEDGYLFITGRSKEVINRGGEIISPTEVEEELLSHPAIKRLVAFATPHDVLQETIGVCIATEKGHPRVGLGSIHAHVAEALHPSKWPQLVVYADDIPKTATGKAMRVRLDKRMGLPTISDSTHDFDRIFEATMVEPGAPVQAPIPTKPIEITVQAATAALLTSPGIKEAFVRIGEVDGKKAMIAYVAPADANKLQLTAALVAKIDEYLVPSAYVTLDKLPRDGAGAVLEDQLPLPTAEKEYEPPETQTQSEMQAVWMQVLGLEKAEQASLRDDFFLSGGSSLLAGKLSGLIKAKFGLPLSGTALFKFRTIEALAAQVDEHNSKQARLSSVNGARPGRHEARSGRRTSRSSHGSGRSLLMRQTSTDGSGKNIRFHQPKKNAPPQRIAPVDSCSFVPLFVQSIPLLLFHPVFRIAWWAFFVYLVTVVHKEWSNRFSFAAIIIALSATKLARLLIYPWIGIAIKWLIIGRFESGRYRLWGSYYLRWWFVTQCLSFFGRGIFRFTHGGRCTYLRLLGAEIGQNVRIARGVRVYEADLLSIGDEAAIDKHVVIEPRAADGAALFLSAIEIGSAAGANCAICSRTVIAPGALLPDNTCLGPLSSSHEIDDATEENRKYCRVAFDPPPLHLCVLLGWPCKLLMFILSWGLPLASIYIMIDDREYAPRDFPSAVNWFLSQRRLLFYFLIRLEWVLVVPFLELFGIVLIKKCVIGKFKEGPVTPWFRFQRWLMTDLLGDGTLNGCHQLLGIHWGGVTFFMRLLGVKCGKRVFWPGSGVEVAETDLLTVSDDAVFGSRSTVMCSDNFEARPVHMAEGANAADRNFILPGVTLGRNGCLGSASLAAADTFFSAGCVTVGSVHNDTVLLNPGNDDPHAAEAKAPTVKPFGRTFYGRRGDSDCPKTATYRVLPVWLFALYNWRRAVSRPFCKSLYAVYRAAQLIITWLIVDYALASGYGMGATAASYSSTPYPVADGAATGVTGVGYVGRPCGIGELPAWNVSTLTSTCQVDGVSETSLQASGTLTAGTAASGTSSRYRQLRLDILITGAAPSSSGGLKVHDGYACEVGKVHGDYCIGGDCPSPYVAGSVPASAPWVGVQYEANASGIAVVQQEIFDYSLQDVVRPVLYKALVVHGVSADGRCSDAEPCGNVACGVITATESPFSVPAYLGLLIGFYILVNLVFVLLAFGAEIAVKWLVIGKRQPGQYPWDTHSYNIRWKVHLATINLRKHLLGYIHGSWYIVAYYRALGSTIGKNVCLFPTGSSPMMTEPDLVTLEDEACINGCFLVCHANTKGVFTLNKVHVGKGATIRSYSRTMAGSVVEKEARLLEHTLVLAGEVVEAGLIWQGWPVSHMLTTKEFWGNRKLSRMAASAAEKTAKKNAHVAFSDGGTMKGKVIAAEAHARRVADENEELKSQLNEQQARLDHLEQLVNALAVKSAAGGGSAKNLASLRPSTLSNSGTEKSLGRPSTASRRSSTVSTVQVKYDLGRSADMISGSSTVEGRYNLHVYRLAATGRTSTRPSIPSSQGSQATLGRGTSVESLALTEKSLPAAGVPTLLPISTPAKTPPPESEEEKRGMSVIVERSASVGSEEEKPGS